MRRTAAAPLLLAVAALAATPVARAQITFPPPTPAAGQRVPTGAELAVVQAAADWWEMIHPDVGPLEIDALFQTSLGALGVADQFSSSGGIPSSCRVRFDDDASFYVDPTPHAGSAGEVPILQFDLLTVAKHEVGHCVGFTIAYGLFGTHVVDPGGGASRTFSCAPPAVTSTLTPAAFGTHLDAVAHPGDLMNPALASGDRRFPSPRDAAMLSCAFAYEFGSFQPVPTAGPLGLVGLAALLVLTALRAAQAKSASSASAARCAERSAPSHDGSTR